MTEPQKLMLDEDAIKALAGMLKKIRRNLKESDSWKDAAKDYPVKKALLDSMKVLERLAGTLHNNPAADITDPERRAELLGAVEWLIVASTYPGDRAQDGIKGMITTLCDEAHDPEDVSTAFFQSCTKDFQPGLLRLEDSLVTAEKEYRRLYPSHQESLTQRIERYFPLTATSAPEKTPYLPPVPDGWKTVKELAAEVPEGKRFELAVALKKWRKTLPNALYSQYVFKPNDEETFYYYSPNGFQAFLKAHPEFRKREEAISEAPSGGNEVKPQQSFVAAVKGDKSLTSSQRLSETQQAKIALYDLFHDKIGEGEEEMEKLTLQEVVQRVNALGRGSLLTLNQLGKLIMGSGMAEEAVWKALAQVLDISPESLLNLAEKAGLVGSPGEEKSWVRF